MFQIFKNKSLLWEFKFIGAIFLVLIFIFIVLFSLFYSGNAVFAVQYNSNLSPGIDNTYDIGVGDSARFRSSKFSGNVTVERGIQLGSTPLAGSQLMRLDSTTRGFIPPRMTSAERDAISVAGAGGLMIFNRTTSQVEFYNGSTWNALSGGGLWTLNGALLYNNNTGNVGIGTSVPKAKLNLQKGSLFVGTSTPVINYTLALGASPTAIQYVNNYIYVLNEALSQLYVIDAGPPELTVLVSTTAIGNTPKAIHVLNGYAYIVEAGTSDSLRIMDISNPTVPITISTLPIGNDPTRVQVVGNYAYITFDNDSSVENFKIIDISNPKFPKIVGRLGTTQGLIRGLTVTGKYAYIIGQSGFTLKIIDISNPLAPVEVGNLVAVQEPQDIVVSGRYIYLVKSNPATFQVIDISNPASPTTVATLAIGALPYRLDVRGRFAYVIDQTSDDLKVIDLRDPQNPILSKTLTLGAGTPQDVKSWGRYLAITDSSLNNLRIYNLQGIDSTTGNFNSTEAGMLQVRGDANIDQSLIVHGGINIGNQGINSLGPIAIATTNVSSYIAGPLLIGSATSSILAKLVVDGVIASSRVVLSPSGGTPVIDVSVGNVLDWTLGGNVSPSFINGYPGAIYTFILKQDIFGARLITWPLNMKFPGAQAPVLSATANAVDILTFVFDGVNFYLIRFQNDVK